MDDDAKRKEADAVFLSILDRLDHSGKYLVALLAIAQRRGDTKLYDELVRVGNAPRDGQLPPINPDDDLEQLERLRRVCPEDEMMWWGRALARAAEIDDRVAYHGLVGLIGKRTAS